MYKKENLLFIILGGFFITNALIAEFIGVKIFSLERTFGFQPFDWTIFGVEGLGFNLTAGVVLWPIVFIMTDVILKLNYEAAAVHVYLVELKAR